MRASVRQPRCWRTWSVALLLAALPAHVVADEEEATSQEDEVIDEC